MELWGVTIDLVGIVTTVIKLILLGIVYSAIVPIGKKIVEKSIQKFGESKRTSPGRIKTLEKLLSNVYFYVITFIFILLFFSTINVDIAPLILGAGVLGLAVAFGAQSLVSDVVTGFFILVEQQLEIDDYVTTAGYDGVVEEVGLRTTKIRSFNGTLNFIPNRFIEGVANHSRGNMRALVDIGISYDDDIDKAIMVLNRICEEFQDDERFKEGPDAVGVQSLGSSDVVIRVVGHTENGLQWACERDMRKRIKQVFDEENIDIPFPHQVIVQQ